MAGKAKKFTRKEIEHMARQGRDKANKMTDAERQSALASAMQMIYGGKNAKKALCR